MVYVAQFTSQLNARLEPRGIVASYGRGGRGRSKNVVRLPTTPKPTVIYVKESNSERAGFWGLTRNHIERFESEGARWFTVLLLRSANEGYVLSGGQVLQRVQHGVFEFGADGEYKINERDLCSEQSFACLDEMLARVF